MTFHEKVADILEISPQRLDIPLRNIDRWLSKNHEAPHRLLQWRSLLCDAQSSPQGFQSLLKLLRSLSESDLQLKSFTPFHGILTREERQPLLKACAFRH